MEIMLEKVKTVIEPILKAKNVELVDIDYKREGFAYRLKVLVDKDGGVTIGECADISRSIGFELDAVNILTDKYTLEVSSPGLDRLLIKKKDFDRIIGKFVRISTKVPIMSEVFYIGKLISVSDTAIRVEAEKGIVEIPLDMVQKAVLDIRF